MKVKKNFKHPSLFWLLEPNIESDKKFQEIKFLF
jgi:hypothetical protein